MCTQLCAQCGSPEACFAFGADRLCLECAIPRLIIELDLTTLKDVVTLSSQQR